MRIKDFNTIEQALHYYAPSLNAVWDNQHLGSNEKFVMLYLTRNLNMTDIIADFRQCIKLKKIQMATGFSESTVKRALKKLMLDGYLERLECINNAGRQVENAYLITTKIFDEYREFLLHLNTEYNKGDTQIFQKKSVVHKAREPEELRDTIQKENGLVGMANPARSNWTPPPVQIERAKPGQIERAKPGQIEPPLRSNNKISKLYNFESAPEVLPKNEIEEHREAKTEAESTNRPAPLKKPRKAIKNANTPEVQATREIVEQFEMVIGKRKITSVEFNKLKSLIKMHVVEFGISFEEVTAVSKQAVIAFARSTEPFAIESNHAFSVFIQGFSKYYCKGESMVKKRSYYEENKEYELCPIVFEDEVS